MRSRIIQPPYMGMATPATINSLGPECLGEDVLTYNNGLTVASNWTANQLVFVPLILRETLLLSQFFWFNGNAVNNNVDVGIYSFDGTTKLISTGSTAASGTSAIQVVNVTDTVIPANTRLWLAIGADGTTRLLSNTVDAARGLEFIGVKQQAAGWSSGLPSTITPATPTVSLCPYFGFTAGVI